MCVGGLVNYRWYQRLFSDTEGGSYLWAYKSTGGLVSFAMKVVEAARG